MVQYQGISGKHSHYVSNLFFIFGLIGAFGLRFAVIAGNFNEFLAALSWYVALIAFLIFYIYRYVIEDKRRRLIIDNNIRTHLINKKLKDNDYSVLLRLIDSILVSKLKLNFIILFGLTALALIVGLIIDF